MKYYVVKYQGPFGFIKPWTAVRDIETFSQQFLTPSIIEGIRIKLDVSQILRHRLSYIGMSPQLEQTQAKGVRVGDKKKPVARKRMAIGEEGGYVNAGIITRNVLLEPHLYLAFTSEDEAQKASEQHLCLCRNEDILYSDGVITTLDPVEFDTQIHGFELRFEPDHPLAFTVGYSRFPLENPSLDPMRGWLQIVGNQIRKENEPC